MIQLTKFSFRSLQQIRDSPNFPKALSIFISIDIQTRNSQQLQVRFPPTISQSERQHLQMGIQVKIIVLLPCIRMLILQLFQRKPFNFTFSQLSNSKFSKTANFISSIGVGIENFLDVQILSKRDLSIFVHCIRVLTVRKIQNVLFLLISPKIQTCVLPPLQVQLPPSRTHFKT